MDLVGKTVSNLIKDQFPEYYREVGPLFVSFVEQYYAWMESQTSSRDNWFVDKTYLVQVENRSANIVGLGSLFTSQFSQGDSIAISKGDNTTDYDVFTIKNIVDDTHLTLTPDRIPNFSHANTRYATVSDKPNSLYLTRRFFEFDDIDETLDQFVVYFKEKYLKGLQFKTITDTKTLIKHSLDLYRSKGTARSIDLLYKIAFGKPAKVYYPGQDIFRLSSGEWYIPRYLELSLNINNKQLVNKEVVGVLSGATAFVEAVVRRSIDTKLVDVAYISAINGSFRTGEKITLSDNSLSMSVSPTIIGSLNELQFDINGSGSSFEVGDVVDIQSTFGRAGIGKILTTSNTTGHVSFELADGGYGYSNTTQVSNTTGNVSVNTSSSIVVGDGTLFETEYSVGDYISVWSSPSAYETHQIETISSNTSLTVDSTFAFANNQTKASYTRYFAQTFISEKILSISNATYSVGYTNFEYVPFLNEITQPGAVLNYENANGTFAEGDSLFTYYANNDEKGTGTVLTVSRKTSTTGILTIAVLSGNCEDNAIFTTANAIGANLAVSNGYYDTTATANAVGNYSNVSITVSGVVDTFIEGEDIVQTSSGARGNILSVSANQDIISIANSEGVFINGYGVIGSESAATATVDSVSFDVGVISIANSFNTLPGNRIYTSQMEGTLTAASSGSGANVVFGNTIIYSEDITYAVDFIYPYVALQIGAASWPFVGDPTANLSSSIGDTLSYANITIGKAESIIATSTGENYNKIPIIRLHEPSVFAFNLPDTLAITFTDTSGFTNGEVITQEDSNARGLVKGIIDSSTLLVQNMRFYANNGFVATSNATTTIIGADSGYTSNIVSIEIHTKSNRLGMDATLDSMLTAGAGSVTAAEVIDSGFGFTNGEHIVVTNDAGLTANGYAVLQTHGTGSGYYKSTDGFLSDVKKLADGYYYQEYSYEVRSAVIDDFKKILKKIVHVAGTQSFDAVVYDSINTIDTSVNTTITQI